MSIHESFPESASLNPEGYVVTLDTAKEKLQELIDANDGKHTDVFNAKGLIVEAEKMCEELSEITEVGEEISVMVRELRSAIDHLNDAMKQVH